MAFQLSWDRDEEELASERQRLAQVRGVMKQLGLGREAGGGVRQCFLPGEIMYVVASKHPLGLEGS